MKSYTDLEQSKKLAEILPLESADMHSEAIEIDGDMVFVVVCGLGDKNKNNYGSPIWSLDALLDNLPYPSLAQHANELWSLTAWVETVEPYSVDGYDNKIDACFAMIIKLYELKKL